MCVLLVEEWTFANYLSFCHTLLRIFANAVLFNYHRNYLKYKWLPQSFKQKKIFIGVIYSRVTQLVSSKWNLNLDDPNFTLCPMRKYKIQKIKNKNDFKGNSLNR